MSESDRAAAVLVCERHILATEGPYHVGGVYYANPFDAERQRRWAAERMVREAARREAAGPAAGLGPRPKVGTWLTPRERARVDAAAWGHLALTHRDALHAIRADLAAGITDAALVSVALVRVPDVPALSALVRDFPGSPVVGLVVEADEPQTLAGALAFGRAGVTSLVDARTAAGWSALRSAFDPQHLPDAFVRRAIRELTGAADASGNGAACSAGWARFLTAAFAPRASSAKVLAASLGVLPSTLMSRFFRAGLPSPKQYVAFARLVWACRMAETPGLSIAAIAHRLDASSPQSFGRTVRTMMGMTAAELRSRFDGEAMLAHFRATLVDPYRDTLRTFDPLRVSQAERTERAAPRRALRLAGRAA